MFLDEEDDIFLFKQVSNGFQVQRWQVEDLARRSGLYLLRKEPFPKHLFPTYCPVWGDDRDFERRQPWQIYSGTVNVGNRESHMFWLLKRGETRP